MPRPWLSWFRRIAIAMAVAVAALALPWAPLLPPLWRWVPQQWDTRIVIAIAIDAALMLLAVLLATLWWLWWRLPQRQVARLSIQIPDPKARADAEDNFRKTVGQALGGAAVLIGAGAAYLQFTQQQQASHDLLISNQVSKGFEQLASDKLTMRLGGIYALEGVMNGSAEYHQAVLEALCAFVRDDTIGMIVNDTARQDRRPGPKSARRSPSSSEQTNKADRGPAIDIQAALTVIGRRADGPGEVKLVRASLSDAFLRDANLHGADLNGANLRDTSLNRANLNDADLRDANLNGAKLQVASLNRASLNDADLGDANLHGANLYDADLSGANLILADLSVANLRGADLSSAHLSAAHLNDADLRSAHLIGAVLVTADLSGAHLNLSDLSGAHLSESRLNRADLSFADLRGANLRDADLSGADLRGAHLSGARLNRADLSGARLNRADLTSWTVRSSWMRHAAQTRRCLPA
jgi:uncharacterized protein YjbI with pentapeptide repeats